MREIPKQHIMLHLVCVCAHMEGTRGGPPAGCRVTPSLFACCASAGWTSPWTGMGGSWSVGQLRRRRGWLARTSLLDRCRRPLAPTTALPLSSRSCLPPLQQVHSGVPLALLGRRRTAAVYAARPGAGRRGASSGGRPAGGGSCCAAGGARDCGGRFGVSALQLTCA